jgi:hypothetical protein
MEIVAELNPTPYSADGLAAFPRRDRTNKLPETTRNF